MSHVDKQIRLVRYIIIYVCKKFHRTRPWVVHRCFTHYLKAIKDFERTPCKERRTSHFPDWGPLLFVSTKILWWGLRENLFLLVLHHFVNWQFAQLKQNEECYMAYLQLFLSTAEICKLFKLAKKCHKKFLTRITKWDLPFLYLLYLESYCEKQKKYNFCEV